MARRNKLPVVCSVKITVDWLLGVVLTFFEL